MVSNLADAILWHREKFAEMADPFSPVTSHVSGDAWATVGREALGVSYVIAETNKTPQDKFYVVDIRDLQFDEYKVECTDREFGIKIPKKGCFTFTNARGHTITCKTNETELTCLRRGRYYAVHGEHEIIVCYDNTVSITKVYHPVADVTWVGWKPSGSIDPTIVSDASGNMYHERCAKPMCHPLAFVSVMHECMTCHFNFTEDEAQSALEYMAHVRTRYVEKYEHSGHERHKLAMTDCRHIFHLVCLMKWKHASPQPTPCPMCRAEIKNVIHGAMPDPDGTCPICYEEFGVDIAQTNSR